MFDKGAIIVYAVSTFTVDCLSNSSFLHYPALIVHLYKYIFKQFISKINSILGKKLCLL